MKSVPNDTYAIFLPAKNIPVGLYVLFIGRSLSQDATQNLNILKVVRKGRGLKLSHGRFVAENLAERGVPPNPLTKFVHAWGC